MAKMDTVFDKQELSKCIWVEVTVKSSRFYELRFRIGTWLMRLGQEIAGIGAVKVKIDDTRDAIKDDFHANSNTC